MEFERIQFENNASARLSRSLAATETVLPLEAGSGAYFPMVRAGQWYPLTVEDVEGGLETMRCIGRDGDQLTVERGQEGCVARAFAIGSLVELRLTRRVLGTLSHDLALLERQQDEARRELAVKADRSSTLGATALKTVPARPNCPKSAKWRGRFAAHRRRRGQVAQRVDRGRA